MATVRSEAVVQGTVQGVGFRPFIYRLATSLGLTGSVRNAPDGVVIDIEGEEQAVSLFLERLTHDPPPLSRISSLRVSYLTPAGRSAFTIVESTAGQPPAALTPPDVALCPDCARETEDPSDRRFGYAFTNCTNCGPRFSIVTGIPYDRRQTTMSAFAMCSSCEAEYTSPLDRRFHAEPIACSECGPRLLLDGAPAPDAIDRVADLLARGRIVAIKGLGGYHLACDAANPRAVETLHTRKGRGQKPFAVMVRDLQSARGVAAVESRAAALLASPESPVVIVPSRRGNVLAPGVAPRQATVGIMLPYTPLHRLLLARSSSALVMTSGNLAEEPIIHDDDEARRKLGPIADHILSHDREIAVPCDDSVVRCSGDLTIPVRRARGYVPRPIPVDIDGPPILAVGGHHKNTFCLLRDGEAILSQHIGDLDSLEVLEYFDQAVAHFQRLFQTQPAIIAHDLHPAYLSTRYAQSQAHAELVPVQHHHAHVVSVMAELGLAGPVIGVSYDGTGYGTDGTIWGGEVLVADRRDFRRAFHLHPLPLPGGEAAVAHPCRMALACLADAFGYEEAERAARDLLPGLTGTEIRVVLRQLERRLNSPLTSSMGRFFDAIGALLGVTPIATYEGQPAMELESMAAESPGRAAPYPYAIEDDMIDARPIIRAVVNDLRQRVDRSLIASRFHTTVAAFTIDVCERVHEDGGPAEVVLAGGVMQNARLVSLLVSGLPEAGLEPRLSREVPPNDGGLSLGQAVIAAARSQA